MRPLEQPFDLSPGCTLWTSAVALVGLLSISRGPAERELQVSTSTRQIRRGEVLVQRAGLDGSCAFLYADYMDVPMEDRSFDAAYSFEALCHAPNRTLAFRELFRLLKPNAEAAIVDWCLTDTFDSANARHNAIRAEIERTNATPELPTMNQYVDAVLSAGFEVIEAVDQQESNGHPTTPWYMALQKQDVSLSSFARTPTGRIMVEGVLRVLEQCGMATGMSGTARILNAAADALVEAGEMGIFTPSFLVHARKPV